MERDGERERGVASSLSGGGVVSMDTDSDVFPMDIDLPSESAVSALQVVSVPLNVKSVEETAARSPVIQATKKERSDAFHNGGFLAAISDRSGTTNEGKAIFSTKLQVTADELGAVWKDVEAPIAQGGGGGGFPGGGGGMVDQDEEDIWAAYWVWIQIIHFWIVQIDGLTWIFIEIWIIHVWIDLEKASKWSVEKLDSEAGRLTKNANRAYGSDVKELVFAFLYHTAMNAIATNDQLKIKFHSLFSNFAATDDIQGKIKDFEDLLTKALKTMEDSDCAEIILAVETRNWRWNLVSRSSWKCLLDTGENILFCVLNTPVGGDSRSCKTLDHLLGVVELFMSNCVPTEGSPKVQTHIVDFYECPAIGLQSKEVEKKMLYKGPAKSSCTLHEALLKWKIARASFISQGRPLMVMSAPTRQALGLPKFDQGKGYILVPTHVKVLGQTVSAFCTNHPAAIISQAYNTPEKSDALLRLFYCALLDIGKSLLALAHASSEVQARADDAAQKRRASNDVEAEEPTLGQFFQSICDSFQLKNGKNGTLVTGITTLANKITHCIVNEEAGGLPRSSIRAAIGEKAKEIENRNSKRALPAQILLAKARYSDFTESDSDFNMPSSTKLLVVLVMKSSPVDTSMIAALQALLKESRVLVSCVSLQENGYKDKSNAAQKTLAVKKLKSKVADLINGRDARVFVAGREIAKLVLKLSDKDCPRPLAPRAQEAKEIRTEFLALAAAQSAVEDHAQACKVNKGLADGQTSTAVLPSASKLLAALSSAGDEFFQPFIRALLEPELDESDFVHPEAPLSGGLIKAICANNPWYTKLAGDFMLANVKWTTRAKVQEMLRSGPARCFGPEQNKEGASVDNNKPDSDPREAQWFKMDGTNLSVLQDFVREQIEFDSLLKMLRHPWAKLLRKSNAYRNRAVGSDAAANLRKVLDPDNPSAYCLVTVAIGLGDLVKMQRKGNSAYFSHQFELFYGLVKCAWGKEPRGGRTCSLEGPVKLFAKACAVNAMTETTKASAQAHALLLPSPDHAGASCRALVQLSHLGVGWSNIHLPEQATNLPLWKELKKQLPSTPTFLDVKLDEDFNLAKPSLGLVCNAVFGLPSRFAEESEVLPDETHSYWVQPSPSLSSMANRLCVETDSDTPLTKALSHFRSDRTGCQNIEDPPPSAFNLREYALLRANCMRSSSYRFAADTVLPAQDQSKKKPKNIVSFALARNQTQDGTVFISVGTCQAEAKLDSNAQFNPTHIYVRLNTEPPGGSELFFRFPERTRKIRQRAPTWESFETDLIARHFDDDDEEENCEGCDGDECKGCYDHSTDGENERKERKQREAIARHIKELSVEPEIGRLGKSLGATKGAIPCDSVITKARVATSTAATGTQDDLHQLVKVCTNLYHFGANLAQAAIQFGAALSSSFRSIDDTDTPCEHLSSLMKDLTPREDDAGPLTCDRLLQLDALAQAVCTTARVSAWNDFPMTTKKRKSKGDDTTIPSFDREIAAKRLLVRLCAASCLGHSQDIPAGVEFSLESTESKRKAPMVFKQAKSGQATVSLVFEDTGNTWMGTLTLSAKADLLSEPKPVAAPAGPLKHSQQLKLQTATFGGEDISRPSLELHQFVQDPSKHIGEPMALSLNFGASPNINLTLVKPAALILVALLQWAGEIQVQWRPTNLLRDPQSPGQVLRSLFKMLDGQEELKDLITAHTSASKALQKATNPVEWRFTREQDTREQEAAIMHSDPCELFKFVCIALNSGPEADFIYVKDVSALDPIKHGIRPFFQYALPGVGTPYESALDEAGAARSLCTAQLIVLSAIDQDLKPMLLSKAQLHRVDWDPCWDRTQWAPRKVVFHHNLFLQASATLSFTGGHSKVVTATSKTDEEAPALFVSRDEIPRRVRFHKLMVGGGPQAGGQTTKKNGDAKRGDAAKFQFLLQSRRKAKHCVASGDIGSNPVVTQVVILPPRECDSTFRVQIHIANGGSKQGALAVESSADEQRQPKATTMTGGLRGLSAAKWSEFDKLKKMLLDFCRTESADDGVEPSLTKFLVGAQAEQFGPVQDDKWFECAPQKTERKWIELQRLVATLGNAELGKCLSQRDAKGAAMCADAISNANALLKTRREQLGCRTHARNPLAKALLSQINEVLGQLAAAKNRAVRNDEFHFYPSKAMATSTPGLLCQTWLEPGPVHVTMVWGKKSDRLHEEFAGFAGVDPGIITPYTVYCASTGNVYFIGRGWPASVDRGLGRRMRDAQSLNNKQEAANLHCKVKNAQNHFHATALKFMLGFSVVFLPDFKPAAIGMASVGSRRGAYVAFARLRDKLLRVASLRAPFSVHIVSEAFTTCLCSECYTYAGQFGVGRRVFSCTNQRCKAKISRDGHSAKLVLVANLAAAAAKKNRALGAFSGRTAQMAPLKVLAFRSATDCC